MSLVRNMTNDVPVAKTCWSCDRPEDSVNYPENPFVLTAHSETPNEPFALMHNDCRKKLDLVVWTRQ